MDKWDRATLLSIVNGSNATAIKKCGGTFSETKGTAFYWLHTDHDQVSDTISLMKHGCLPQAIVATFHESLRILAPAGVPRKWVERPPAMAAGLTNHRWSMKEILSYKVTPKSKTKIVHG